MPEEKFDPDTGELLEAGDRQLDLEEVLLRDKPRLSLEAYEDKLRRLCQTPAGDELPDPTPIAPPIGWHKQPSMVEHIAAMVRSEHLRHLAELEGMDTFEEADDFDIPGEDQVDTGYAMADDYEPVSVFRARMAALEAEQRAEVQRQAPPPEPGATPPQPAPQAAGDPS